MKMSADEAAKGHSFNAYLLALTATYRADRGDDFRLGVKAEADAALAKLMDGAFVIPGTNIRMGLDGIIGLVPIAGDLVSGLISSYLIWEARKLGASRWVIGRMMANTLIDTTIGAVPVLGDAFDVAFRANTKNLALLKAHLEKQGFVSRRAAGPRGPGPVIEGTATRIT